MLKVINITTLTTYFWCRKRLERRR